MKNIKKQCPIKRLGIKGLEYVLSSLILVVFPIVAHKIAGKLYKKSTQKNSGCPICKLWRK